MKNKLYIKKISVFLLILTLLLSLANIPVRGAADIYVSPNQDAGWYDETHVATIQEAINNYTTGVIYVWDGNYDENVTVNKSATIIGNSTETVTLTDSGGGIPVTISEDSVSISNIKIHNSSATAMYLDYTNYTNISSLSFIDIGDFIIETSARPMGHNEFYNLNARNTVNAILLESMHNISIINCDIINVTRTGVGEESVSLYLSEVTDAIITGCNISDSSTETSWGILLEGTSSNITFYNNYISNFTYLANDTGNVTWNTTKQSGTNIIGESYLGGNYWGDYTGTDTDADGLGNTDTPYNSSGGITSGGDYLPLVGLPTVIYVSDNMSAGWYNQTQVATIQEGIDNVSSNGGTVYIWDGNYSGNVTINSSVDITGNSSETVIVNGSNSGSLFTINETSYVNISGIYFFDCGTKNDFPCDYWNVSAGVKFTFSDNCNISNCKFYANLVGIFLHVANNISIYNNSIYTYTHISNQSGILGYYLNDTTMSTNYIDCANDSEGIILVGDDAGCGYCGYNNVIYNNTIFYPEHYGIRIVEHHNTEIYENYIYSDNASPIGITIYSLASGSHVHNNTVYCGYGIWVENDNDEQSLMRDVLIRDNYFDVIDKSYFSDFLNLTMINNTFVADGGESTAVYITSYTTNRYLNFSENVLTGTGYGMYSKHIENANISSNLIYNITNDGLYLTYVENASIINCTICECDCGVRVDDVAEFCSFYDNYIYNNSHGFEIGASCNNNTIYNNYFSNTDNACDAGTNNYWNTTKTSGTNIIGGSWIFGNYWSDYSGTDADGDGIGDTSYDVGGCLV